MGELESSLSDAGISFSFGRIWKGLLQNDGAFEELFSAVLPHSSSLFHCSLSGAQPTISGNSAARDTAEGMVWLSAAMSVLLQHP